MRTESSPFFILLLHCALCVDWCLQKSCQIALEKPGDLAFTLIFGILLENCPRLCFRTHSSRQCVDMWIERSKEKRHGRISKRKRIMSEVSNGNLLPLIFLPCGPFQGQPGRTSKRLQFLQQRWGDKTSAGQIRMGDQSKTDWWVFPSLPLSLAESFLLTLLAPQNCQGCWEAQTVNRTGRQGPLPRQALQHCFRTRVFQTRTCRYNEASSAGYQLAIHHPVPLEAKCKSCRASKTLVCSLLLLWSPAR